MLQNHTVKVHYYLTRVTHKVHAVPERSVLSFIETVKAAVEASDLTVGDWNTQTGQGQVKDSEQVTDVIIGLTVLVKAYLSNTVEISQISQEIVSVLYIGKVIINLISV